MNELPVKHLVTAAALALVLAACASTPKRNEQLEAARTEVEKVSQDPMAQQAAAADIQSARASLQEAESAFQRHRPPEEVDHLAYLAARHAQAGEARVQEAHARQEVAKAGEERQRLLVQSRERETQAARAQAATAQSQLNAAQQQLKDLQAKQTNRGMVVTLSDVLFDTGQATLKPGADLELSRLADYLKQNQEVRAIIEGFTDNRGSADYNQELSQRRARAVAEALSSRGVPADRFETKGMGKDFPVASNATNAGRQQNRRVEIVLSDNAGRFAEGAATPESQRR